MKNYRLAEAKREADLNDAIERLDEVAAQDGDADDALDTVKDVLAAYRMEVKHLRTAAAEYFREFDHLIGDDDYPERAALRHALEGS